ncbi:MAG: hypothetical protein Q8N81_02540, partial [bacterium]|nr:hypothetical protein [bacterium]
SSATCCLSIGVPVIWSHRIKLKCSDLEQKYEPMSIEFQGNRIWDAPPSALPGANLLKRLPNISK